MTDYEVIVLAVRHNVHGETTDAQAIAFARTIRRAALEEAAKVCEALESRISAGMLDAHERSGAPIEGGYLNACDDCADAIRALSQKEV